MMSKVTRRQMIQSGSVAAVAAGTGLAAVLAQEPDATVVVPNPVEPDIMTPPSTPEARPRLRARMIPKWEDDLPIPAAMPKITDAPDADSVDVYDVAIRQFDQQVLPKSTGLSTTVWGMGANGKPETFAFPSPTIEATVGRPTRVTWRNQLVDINNDYLPHLLPVDPTLHWANPGGGEAQRDQHRVYRTGQYPRPYSGPVPFVVHLHGIHVTEESDGYTESWTLPPAKNIPEGYALVGSTWEAHAKLSEERHGQTWEPGSQVCTYPNNQPASTVWFHDHTLGMTRLNVYAGPAGFYLLRGGEFDVKDGELPGPAPKEGDAPGTAYYEIPLAIQDRSFNADGSLFYPDRRAHFDGYEGPFIPMSDVSPMFNPEVFGDTMLVNGKVWPKLDVEPRRYRFRVLNGCNSRFIILKIAQSPNEARPVHSHVPLWQIGSDVGYLDKPEFVDRLLLAPAERADIIVDFTGVAEGTELYLINEGPDTPFGGGELERRITDPNNEEAGEDGPEGDFEPALVETTGQVMKFVVGKLNGEDTSTPVDQLVLPHQDDLGPAFVVRRMALLEQDSRMIEGVGPMEATLGIIDEEGNAIPKDWEDPITETPVSGQAEIWEFHNRTVDAHPIHLHETLIRVLERSDVNGMSRDPEPGERGFKDTVICYPDEITRVKVKFENPGVYVWHCHVLEHEDHEMMRKFRIVPPLEGD